MHETDKKNINPVLMKAGVVKRRCVLIPQTKGLQGICEVFRPFEVYPGGTFFAIAQQFSSANCGPTTAEIEREMK